MTRLAHLHAAAGVLLLAFVAAADAAPAARRPLNVLFFAADDLRNDLGCYGSTEVKTPHLDALARRGVVFNRAYCQLAVCGPSRASIMTGLRPDTTQVTDQKMHFRDRLPSAVTLPQHFKANGYTTVGIGKLFHNAPTSASGLPFADPVSWSREPRFASGGHSQDWIHEPAQGEKKRKAGPVQCLEVADNAYWDGKIADEACAALREFQASGEPFFLGVGFWKPHLPFNAPKRYWDLYDRAKISLPGPAHRPIGAPDIAGHTSGEFRSYDGIPKQGPIPADWTAELRHGYYAGISYLDAQLGRVMAELDRTGLAANTVIVFWSDHGYHLGEHDLWGKRSNYELDARVPLIISAPGQAAGVRTDALAELIDVYPTLVEFCRLPRRAELEGRSLAPVLADPKRAVKDVALTQHGHPTFGEEATHMGYALRTDRFRYVEWRELKTGEVTARELYDHSSDPRETRNVINDRRFRAAVTELESRARALVPSNAPASGGKSGRNVRRQAVTP